MKILWHATDENEFISFGDLGYKTGDLPQTERAAQEVLALPIYPELTDAQIGYVAERIREFPA